MELSQEYILSQYQELGTLNGNESVRLVRHSVTGRVAVKKCMKIGQKPVYDFLKLHRNEFIPEIYGYFVDGSQLIIIEEYIEGRNLEDILCEQGLSEAEGVRIVKEICRALYPLHTAVPPIICRDLKPENIMLTLQKRVKLVDFDIARVVSPEKSRDTVIMGTEGFAAPEQFGHRQTDGRSDIYALGTLLNYMLLRKFPVEEIMPGELGRVVRRCIAINPDERYQSVIELEGELERLYPGRNVFAERRSDRGEESTEECKKPENRNNSKNRSNKLSGGQSPAWRRFLPPGFRSGRVWKMFLAVIGYLLLINLCLSMEIKENDVVVTGARATCQRVLVLLAQLAEIAFLCNYIGCREKIPLLRSDNILFRIAGYVVLELAFMVIAALVWLTIDLLIF